MTRKLARLVAAGMTMLPLVACLPSASATTDVAHTVDLCAPASAGHMSCQVLRRETAGGQTPDLPTTTPQGFTPTDLQSAYNVVSAAATKGAGQRIYVSTAYNDSTISSDLGEYRSEYNLPDCTIANGCLQVLNQTGGTTLPAAPPANDDWATQTAVEVDMISAICPLCDITVMEATSDQDNGLDIDIETATTLGAKFVVIPWGGPEYTDETSEDSTYFASSGVAYVAAGGDQGASGGTIWPASSPDVIAVGGTTLTKASSTSRGWAETAWVGAMSGAQSGCSTKETTKPSWQSIISTTVCANRADNDVAAVADPQSGVAIYDTSAGGWSLVGGTTVAAPIITAIYALAGTPAPSSHPAALPYADPSGLNDITTSSGNTTCSQPQLCHAGVGWDGPTGLGTPNGLAAFTPPADKSALSIETDKSIAAGQALTISTVATDTTSNSPLSGAKAQLFARTGTSRSFVAGPSEITSGKGVAAAKVAPQRNTVYEWRLAGTPAHAAATSATAAVKVSQVVALGVKPGHVKHGKHFALYGTVSPSASGAKIAVEVLKGRSWRRAGSAKLKRQNLPSGKTAVGYVVSLKESRKGTYSFRVVAPATTVNAAGTSKTVKVVIA